MNVHAMSVICTALRSGRYRQGRKMGKSSTCVGGVIMTEYMQEHKLAEIKSVRDFQRWIGLSDNGMDEFADWTEKVNRDFTFIEIADLIEERYSYLKVNRRIIMA